MVSAHFWVIWTQKNFLTLGAFLATQNLREIFGVKKWSKIDFSKMAEKHPKKGSFFDQFLTKMTKNDQKRPKISKIRDRKANF